MKRGLRVGGAVIGWSAIVSVTIIAAILITGALTIFGANVGGEVAKRSVHGRVKQRVFSPDNAIANVAFFHDRCRGVVRDYRVWQNNQAQLRVDEQAARYASDPIRRQQAGDSLQVDAQNVTGAANVLAGDAQDYNSRSAQYTANPFKDAGLPYRIEPPAVTELAAWTPPDCK